jgi:protein TonB
MTGTTLATAVGVGVLVLIALILLGRYYFNRLGEQNLSERHRETDNGHNVRSRNKYPEVNVLNYSPIFLRFSLIIVLAFTIAAFSWTIYDKQVDIPDDALAMDFDIEVEKPRTAAPPPPPPPPPPPSIEAVNDIELLDEEDDIEFVDQSVDENTYIDAPVFSENENEAAAPPPPPPPPPPPEPEVEEIFKVVEDMPRFPGCEDMTASKDEMRMCANRKMLEFIYENIRYPALARDNNIEGTAVVSFVVDKEGRIEDAQVVRDIGGGCGAEALRVVKMMNQMDERWTPGMQRGRPVKVLFNLPVKFRLEIK